MQYVGGGGSLWVRASLCMLLIKRKGGGGSLEKYVEVAELEEEGRQKSEHRDVMETRKWASWPLVSQQHQCLKACSLPECMHRACRGHQRAFDPQELVL